MMKNYFRIAWRNLQRSRFFAALNIAGLAFGMAVCFFILCWVADEYSVDKFHANGKDIYRLHVNADWGGIRTMSTTPVVLGDELKNTFPEITANVKVRPFEDNMLFKTNGKTQVERKAVYA
ncbi:ABC transporter permease, partial [Chitinophaga sp.]|uniref:ABC transporter permease n=1 Tax=Chitinophaga sp. TaxID=1869181 RepID=UPI002F94BCBE